MSSFSFSQKILRLNGCHGSGFGGTGSTSAAAVCADTAWLDTLPEEHLRSGLAEAIKAAVVRDARLIEDLRARREAILARDEEAMDDMLARCCAIKAQVVAADPCEGDLRQILNFGHTIGHAIEALSGFTMLHGEAVAIGMVAETRMAARQVGLSAAGASAIEDLIAAFGLPCALPEAARRAGARAILEAARTDKKARAGSLRYVLPRSPGEMARSPEGYGIPVPDAVALQVLERMA